MAEVNQLKNTVVVSKKEKEKLIEKNKAAKSNIEGFNHLNGNSLGISRIIPCVLINMLKSVSF